MRWLATLVTLVAGAASVCSCTTGEDLPEAEAPTGDEELQADGTVGPFEDETDVGEPALPYDTGNASEDDLAVENAKSDEEDEQEALEAIGDDLDTISFDGVDLPYKTGSGMDEATFEVKSVDVPPIVSCRKRIYVDFQALGGMDGPSIAKRSDPVASCWQPSRITQDGNWRGCFFGKASKHAQGHHWYYDVTTPSHAKSAEVGEVKACANTPSQRLFGYQLMQYDAGWRFVQAPRTASYFLRLFDGDNDIDSLWYKKKVYRENATVKAHGRAAPGINIGANKKLMVIGREVYKLCRKTPDRRHLYLYSTAPLDALVENLAFGKQSEAAQRMAVVVKALDVCTKRRIVDDGCFGKPNFCDEGQVCAWNGSSYCCRTPGNGAQSCPLGTGCTGENVCAVGVGGRFSCVKPACGTVSRHASEADHLEKCTVDPQQWWAGPKKRDLTFVAFGDPHVNSLSADCPVNAGAGPNHSELMRKALNSVPSHTWPDRSGFTNGKAPYDHVRGVLIAGDLTQAGSEAEPASAKVCQEYTAYRNVYGRCGNDPNKLLFPVYDSYGNHDFPRIPGEGDASYHPVVDYLARITAEYRPGSAKDLFDDPIGATGHYAWRWDDIWFVNVDLKPSNTDEFIAKADTVRIGGPHGALRFLSAFLEAQPKSTKRQIVLMSHYPMSGSRTDKNEKEAFCKVIRDAQLGAGPFSSQKLASANPVVAYIYGHTHRAPEHSMWSCPSPYDAIKIPHFDTGTPLYAGMQNGPGNLHFTIFRIGSGTVEVVGVSAPSTDPEGTWTSVYKQRLGIMLPPE